MTGLDSIKAQIRQRVSSEAMAKEAEAMADKLAPEVAEVHEFGGDVIPAPKRKSTRKERRHYMRGVIQMEKFRKRVYKLSKKLQTIPYDEVRIGSPKFQHEVHRLHKLGMIKVPPGGYNENPKRLSK